MLRCATGFSTVLLVLLQGVLLNAVHWHHCCDLGSAHTERTEGHDHHGHTANCPHETEGPSPAFPQRSHDEDNCPVCRILAEQAVVEGVELPVAAERCSAAVPHFTVLIGCIGPCRCYHSRAPPSSGCSSADDVI